MIGVRSWASTHPGTKRGHNEDSCVNRPDLGLWAVADGAGGHDAGALAAGLLTETLEAIEAELSAGELLGTVRARIDAVHAALLAEAARRGPDVVIASTIVILIQRGEHFACLWAGDSRAYRLRGGVLHRITRDHSLVQELVDSGRLAPEAAEGHPRANVVTRAIGAGDSVLLDKATDLVCRGDRFLLCSDGLTKSLTEDEIATLLGSDGGEIAEALVAAAVEKLASDNVTAVALEVI